MNPLYTIAATVLVPAIYTIIRETYRILCGR